MILRYNLLNLLKTMSKSEILFHLERRLTGRMITGKDIIASAEPLPSFLLESESYICYNNTLNENFRNRATIEERIVYLYLAGKRDFLEYKMRGITTIPVEFSDLPVEKLRLNNLLDIRDNLIHFKNVPTTLGKFGETKW